MGKKEAKKIVITSGKGGVGKTTVSANVGVFLAKLGFRVLLIDVDFGLNNLDVVLGMENKVFYGISDILDGRCRAKQALIQHDKYKNLYILPSDKTYSGVSGQNIKLIIENFKYLFDYIFLDCPAGIDVGFHRAVSCVNEAYVVITPSLTSVKDAGKVVSILKSYKLDYVGLIVNKVRGDLVAGNKVLLPLELGNMLKTELIGVLPEEDEMLLSYGKELNKFCDSYKAYKVLADNIVSGRRRIYDNTSKYTGFFGSIRRTIKENI